MDTEIEQWMSEKIFKFRKFVFLYGKGYTKLVGISEYLLYMAEGLGESFQLASVDRRITEQKSSDVFIRPEDRKTQTLERQIDETSTKQVEIEELLNSDASEFLTPEEKKALLSVISNEHKILLASLGNGSMGGSESNSEISPETLRKVELFKEFLRDVLEILKELLMPDAIDIALLALPIAGESAIVARRIEKLRHASVKFMETLRKYEGRGINTESFKSFEKVFNSISNSAGKDLRGMDEAINIYRGKTKGKYPIKERELAESIANDLTSMRKEVEVISKETMPILELRLGMNGYTNRLHRYYPKESIGKIGTTDLVKRKPEVLYDIEQFQLYLKTVKGIPTEKKEEVIEGFIKTMNEVLSRHGITEQGKNLEGLINIIHNLK